MVTQIKTSNSIDVKIKMNYSGEEKCEIIRIFYKNNKNAISSQNECRNFHPGRPVYIMEIFRYTDEYFRERSVPPNEIEQLNILLYFEGKMKINLIHYVQILYLYMSLRTIVDVSRFLNKSIKKIRVTLHKILPI